MIKLDSKNPLSINIALCLLVVVSTCFISLSIPACIFGVFIGPQIFFPGVALVVVGLLLLYLGENMMHRRPWSRRLLIFLAASIALALLAATAQSSLHGEIGTIEMSVLIFVGLLFIVLVLTLSTSSVSIWFRRANEGDRVPETDVKK